MKCCGLIWGIMAGLAFSACLGPRSASTATEWRSDRCRGTACSEPTPYRMVFREERFIENQYGRNRFVVGMTIPTRNFGRRLLDGRE